jgi:hypothetical protein
VPGAPTSNRLSRASGCTSHHSFELNVDVNYLAVGREAPKKHKTINNRRHVRQFISFTKAGPGS